MAYITTQPYKLPDITIGDGVTNGASIFANIGAGYQISFDATSDDEYLFNVTLGSGYAGQDVALELCWLLFSTAPSASDTVIWEVDYAFVKSDGTEDAYTLADGNNVDAVVVDSFTADRKYDTTLTTMTGKVGAADLQITLRRNSIGAGADSYSGSADIYGLTLNLV